MSIPTNNTPTDTSGLDDVDAVSSTTGVSAESLELRRAERDYRTRNLLRTNDEINGLNLFGFLITLFMGMEGDEGLTSDEAVTEMASALSIDLGAFQATVSDYQSGELTAYDAARQTTRRMDISRADMTRAENVVAEYAETGNPLLELIADKESGGDYNRVYGAGVKREDLTNMTIDQVLAWQRSYVNGGSPSSAAGKYQIIRKTLAGLKDEMGLTGNELYDEEMQDRMAVHLLNRRGYDDYLAGDIDDATFMRKISQEWASMPKDESGVSYYAGDGLNKAHATPATLLLAMRHAKDVPTGLSATFAEGGVEVNDPAQPDPLVASFDGEGRDQTTLADNTNLDTPSDDPTVTTRPALS